MCYSLHMIWVREVCKISHFLNENRAGFLQGKSLICIGRYKYQGMMVRVYISLCRLSSPLSSLLLSFWLSLHTCSSEVPAAFILLVISQPSFQRSYIWLLTVPVKQRSGREIRWHTLDRWDMAGAWVQFSFCHQSIVSKSSPLCRKSCIHCFPNGPLDWETWHLPLLFIYFSFIKKADKTLQVLSFEFAL